MNYTHAITFYDIITRLYTIKYIESNNEYLTKVEYLSIINKEPSLIPVSSITLIN